MPTYALTVNGTRRTVNVDADTPLIPRMADIPDIKTGCVSRNDRGINGGGEAANVTAPVAIAAAFFDATGVMPRRIPLTPQYVKSLLRV